VGRRDNQNASIVRVVDNVLSDENASFNSLAQPDLIGQQISLNGIVKNATNNIDLMLQEFNSGRRETARPPKPARCRARLSMIRARPSKKRGVSVTRAAR
jgi:hypothetical protein